MPGPLAGQAQTVLGAVAPDAVGVTLPHEHLLIDFTVMFAEPTAASDKGRAWEPVSLSNLGWIRQNFNANLDNLRLLDEQVAQDEILLFKQAGGRTVVDPTPKTLGRDPQALARIARATGLNVIMGAGYYVAASHPADLNRRTVEELAREMIADVTAGVGDTGIRSGLIGEIGTTYPWTENEKKVLRAAIIAQRETGAPLMIHPGRHPGMPMELAEFVRKEGGRMAHVLALVAAVHRDQILMSHDIAYKTSLVKYGGYGYHHLLVNVVPRLRAKGVDAAGLTRLLVENPARAFAFA